MSSFATAYVLVLFAVVAYVARLGVVQRRMARELDSLQENGMSHSRTEDEICRAA